jgi:hypothetical protein
MMLRWLATLSLALVAVACAKAPAAGKAGSLDVQIGEPRVVAVAERDEGWGRFCFPRISTWADGTICVSYSVSADSVASYGSVPGMAVSRDGGKTWSPHTGKLGVRGLLLPNGDRIAVATQKPYPVADLRLPEPAGRRVSSYSGMEYTLYKIGQLQPKLRTIRVMRIPKGSTEPETGHASLSDPLALRYSLNGLFPIVWWGDLRLAPDGSILAGIYPGLMLREDGSADPKVNVFFYRSTDFGHSWKIQGRILYQPDLKADPVGDKRDGFQEPAFLVLADGSLLCVMRTTDGVGIGPMYASWSSDLGKTWSRPNVIAPNGVKPCLLRLDNGVLALTSGRPGVQLRFSTDGKGRQWTEPYDIVPASSKDYNADSCGYTSLLAIGPDRFLVVYSHFKHDTGGGQSRKAIMVREVVVRRST